MTEVRRAIVVFELYTKMSIDKVKEVLTPSMPERYPGFIEGEIVEDRFTRRIYEQVIVDGDVWQRETELPIGLPGTVVQANR